MTLGFEVREAKFGGGGSSSDKSIAPRGEGFRSQDMIPCWSRQLPSTRHGVALNSKANLGLLPSELLLAVWKCRSPFSCIGQCEQYHAKCRVVSRAVENGTAKYPPHEIPAIVGLHDHGKFQEQNKGRLGYRK